MKYGNLKKTLQEFKGEKFGEINTQLAYKLAESCSKNKSYNERECGHKSFDDHEIVSFAWEFYLEHSCDEWIIGELKNAQEFHDNLGKAIEWVQNAELPKV